MLLASSAVVVTSPVFGLHEWTRVSRRKIGPPKVNRTELDEIVARFQVRASHAHRGDVDATVSLSTFDPTPRSDPTAPRTPCWVVRLALPF